MRCCFGHISTRQMLQQQWNFECWKLIADNVLFMSKMMISCLNCDGFKNDFSVYIRKDLKWSMWIELNHRILWWKEKIFKHNFLENIRKLITHAFDVVNHNSIKTNFSLIKRDYQNRTIAVCTQKDKSLHYKTSIIFEFLHFFFVFFFEKSSCV